MDKAKEYAKKFEEERIRVGETILLQQEIEKAYRAGYLQGHTDAQRKETVMETQNEFARELR